MIKDIAHGKVLDGLRDENIEGKDFHTELPIVVDEILKQIGQKS
jgi:hypothetical protein